MILEKPAISSINVDATAFLSGQRKRLLIDNEWRAAKTGAYFEVRDPYDGEMHGAMQPRVNVNGSCKGLPT